jgi:LysM repeat protein
MASTAPTAGGNQYTVKAHDSLAKIAHSNHITVANLMAANSMTSDKLSIGQKLTIPAKTPELGTTEATGPAVTTTTTPAPTPTTATPAPEATPAPAPVVKTPAAKPAKTVVAKASPKAPVEPHTYTVVKGDTLTKIAHKFKTTPTALMAVNGIADPTKLSIGKKLTIPSKEAHTAKVSTPAAVQPATAEPKVKTSTQVATNNIQ